MSYIDGGKNKTKGKKTMFKKTHCSPRNSSKDESCLDNKLLIKISNILNKYHSADIKIVNSRKKLYDQISRKISEMSQCSSEKCWMTIQEIIKHLSPEELSLFKSSFKPKKPSEWDKNPNTWLTTKNIDDVLKQQMDKYNEFHSYHYFREYHVYRYHVYHDIHEYHEYHGYHEYHDTHEY